MTSWAYTFTPPEGSAVDAVSVSLDSVVPCELAIDANGDLDLRENADGSKDFYLVRGADAVAQWLRVAFHFWLGAWFLDQNEGVPFIESILIKNPDMRLIEQIFRRVILRCPGVAKVRRLELRRAPPRGLVVEGFEVELLDGSRVEFLDRPFVVTGGNNG